VRVYRIHIAIHPASNGFKRHVLKRYVDAGPGTHALPDVPSVSPGIAQERRLLLSASKRGGQERHIYNGYQCRTRMDAGLKNLRVLNLVTVVVVNCAGSCMQSPSALEIIRDIGR
jgi:hypothetical protein